ncbi:ADP-ribosylglycohydrolase family protein [Micromonospora sp. ANENR4]|uniref:ADP-ribosylglycohydrolase family protein n=1 Tax=Micromonospora sp. ANENR4 TaxID=2783662 RepID=UPI00188EA6FD|nr:ADP-ribosylglycohydrolase family protein [Micromonospora sp. ANENR4]MBF5032971.1 ADP-ribosylglycohydrolase family protein [Micromonospora sp. ANENR4]
MTGNTRLNAQVATGMFLGAAAGDALGWPQEARSGLIGGQKERDRAKPQMTFRSWIRHAGHYSSRYHDPVRPGEYSDDTQLLLATARACLAGDRWWQRLTEAELPTWLLYQRGGGGAVLRAAAAWASGRPPWDPGKSARAQDARERYRNAGANGIAMRIAPHVLWADTPRALTQRVVRDGITTHGHPRALVGALIYAFALRHAAQAQATHGFGDSIAAAASGLIDADQILSELPAGWATSSELDHFADAWRDTNKETEQLLEIIADSLQHGAMSNPETTLERIGCTDPKVNGSGTVTATASIYLASRFAARPQGGLLTAAFLRKADTDTLASMTAAILGALHGTDWLGDLALTVQDAAYLAKTAEQSHARTVDPGHWPDSSPRSLREELKLTLFTAFTSKGASKLHEFPDGRRFRIAGLEALDDRLLRARLQLSDGQTVLVDAPIPHSLPPLTRADQQPARRHDDPVVPTAVNPGSAIESASEDARPEAAVILVARSLTRSAAFYAQLTGRDIPVRSGTAHISPGLLLQQQAVDTPIDTASVSVHITVGLLADVARRLGLDAKPSARGAQDVLEVKDPDGRIVRVTQHHNRTQRDVKSER